MDTKPDERELPPAATEMRFIVAPITHVDVRDPSSNDDNTWTMSGYAAVFNQQTTLYDGKFVKLTETIAPQAFDRVLREQPLGQADGVVHFNFGHDMNRAVAATNVPTGQPGSLNLRSDAHGLHFLAKVSRDDPDGVAMASKMRNGVLGQASFAFTISPDGSKTTTTEADGAGPEIDHRTILDLKHLYDVCATPQGAYSQTVVALRGYAAALGQPAPEREATPINPDTGGGNDVSPLGGIADLKAQRLTGEIARVRSRYPLR